MVITNDFSEQAQKIIDCSFWPVEQKGLKKILDYDTFPHETAFDNPSVEISLKSVSPWDISSLLDLLKKKTRARLSKKMKDDIKKFSWKKEDKLYARLVKADKDKEALDSISFVEIGYLEDAGTVEFAKLAYFHPYCGKRIGENIDEANPYGRLWFLPFHIKFVSTCPNDPTGETGRGYYKAICNCGGEMWLGEED